MRKANLNEIDRRFVRECNVSFNRIRRGSRMVTVCIIKTPLHCQPFIGATVQNPEDVEDVKTGSFEAFESALREMSSAYMKKVLRKMYEESTLHYWNSRVKKGDEEGMLDNGF